MVSSQDVAKRMIVVMKVTIGPGDDLIEVHHQPWHKPTCWDVLHMTAALVSAARAHADQAIAQVAKSANVDVAEVRTMYEEMLAGYPDGAEGEGTARGDGQTRDPV